MDAPKSSLDALRIDRKAAPARQSSRWPWLLLLLLLVVAGVAGFWFTRAKAVEVTTAPVRSITGGDAERTVLNASGYVTARRKATISAKITGKVVEVLVEEGMHVKAGQVLARLDTADLEARLAERVGARESSRAQFDMAEKNRASNRQLLERNFISKNAY
ncbi:MAG: efflux transporter, family, subunit, partial [Pedosphaera sp.]|nr:efflux transporter, family, subunit [Pedosphaera sp.]